MVAPLQSLGPSFLLRGPRVSEDVQALPPRLSLWGCVLCLITAMCFPQGAIADQRLALFAAALSDDIPALRMHLAREAPIDARDASGRTALILAASFGKMSALRIPRSAAPTSMPRTRTA